MDELEQLTAWCRRLGSPPSQAETMARQLMKRADQLVVERGCARTEAMAYLLSLVTRARQGEVPAEFLRPPAPGELSK